MYFLFLMFFKIPQHYFSSFFKRRDWIILNGSYIHIYVAYKSNNYLCMSGKISARHLRYLSPFVINIVQSSARRQKSRRIKRAIYARDWKKFDEVISRMDSRNVLCERGKKDVNGAAENAIGKNLITERW